jgi:hypothetical protein
MSSQKKKKKSKVARLKFYLECVRALFFDCLSFVRRFCSSVKRACYWGWALRNNHDWDHGYLDTMVALKLRRMLNAQVGPQSYHDPECKNYLPKVRSLKLAVKLAERLQADKYHESPKYPLDYTFERTERTEEYATFEMVAQNPFRKEKASELYLRLAMDEYARLDRREDRDRQIMYRIIAKYGTFWWD